MSGEDPRKIQTRSQSIDSTNPLTLEECIKISKTTPGYKELSGLILANQAKNQSGSSNLSQTLTPSSGKHTGTIPKTQCKLPELSEEQRNQLFDAQVVLDPFTPRHSLGYSPPQSPRVTNVQNQELNNAEKTISSGSPDNTDTDPGSEPLGRTQPRNEMSSDSTKLSFRDAVVYLKAKLRCGLLIANKIRSKSNGFHTEKSLRFFQRFTGRRHFGNYSKQGPSEQRTKRR